MIIAAHKAVNFRTNSLWKAEVNAAGQPNIEW